MNYEIDFIGVNKHTQDALAICLRWYSEQVKRYIVVVYDGGFEEHGKELCRILRNYYFDGSCNESIDLVICSHGDEDHASGLTVLFDHYPVKNLVINRPWCFLEELTPYITDGRKTKASVERELKKKYSAIAQLEEKAMKAGTIIHDGFSSTQFFCELSPLRILAPTKEMYLRMVIESSKTPFEATSSIGYVYRGILASLQKIQEVWGVDLLREDVSTTPENETSIVLLGDMEREKFLFTGDAGIQALSGAADHAESLSIDLKSINVHQIPHHGGRHNVSSSILDKLVGPVMTQDCRPQKSAFVSVGKDSDHPRRMVTNAYIRRGVNVFEARSVTVRHHFGNIPERKGWSRAQSLSFCEEVEDWDK